VNERDQAAPEALTVTQADRIAAVASVYDCDPSRVPSMALRYAETGDSGHLQVDPIDHDKCLRRAEEFARHREACTAQLRADLERAREELASARALYETTLAERNDAGRERAAALAELASLIEAFGGLCSLAENAVHTSDSSTFRDIELSALRAGCKMARRAIDRAWRRAAAPPAASAEGES